MNNINFILTDQSLTVVIDGKAHTMGNDHPSWNEAKMALAEEDTERLEMLFDVAQAVEDYVDGEIEVKEGVVLFNGEEVNNVVVDKILDFMRSSLPYKPLVRFLGKLMHNPSRRSVNELYRFLEHKSMPLTPEGNFLAYKGVNQDFTDFYSGKFDNSVGQTLEMARNKVCDDAQTGCSYGFHAGSYDYAKGYASGGGNLLVVEIDPRDVVSVPNDCSCQKLRTSKYKVVSVYETIEQPPLDEGLVDDYSDSEWDEDYEEGTSYNDAWKEGYQAAIDKLQQGGE